MEERAVKYGLSIPAESGAGSQAKIKVPVGVLDMLRHRTIP